MAIPKLLQLLASATQVGAWAGSAVYTYFLFNSVKAGNALVIFGTWDNGNAAAPTISDNINGTWPAPIVTAFNTNANSTYTAGWLLTAVGAGVTSITATFGAAVVSFQWDIIELSQITGHNGSSSAINVSGPNLACGSFTPGNNNANGGNFIISYFGQTLLANNASGPNPWVAGASHTLLEADMCTAYNGSASGTGIAHAAQYFLQTTAAAINPSITATGDTLNGYNCVAMALTVGAAGQDPPATIYIAKISHQSLPNAAGSTNFKMQMPWTGNLRFMSSFTGQVLSLPTDSDGYTWVNKATVVNTDFYGYAQNTTPDTNATLTLPMGSQTGGTGMTVTLYDIVNAATPIAFDNYYTSGSGNFINGTTLTNDPHITPVASSGLTIASCPVGTGPFLSVTSPVGAVFDAIHYAGEVDADNYDNADAKANLYFSTNTLQNFSWTIVTSNTNPYIAYAITFASATPVGGAPFSNARTLVKM